MGEAPDQMILVETAEDVERLDRPGSQQGRLSDPDHAQRRRRQYRHRRPAKEVSQHRQPAQRRHLLRDPESPGSRSRAGGPGRPRPGAGQPEQLQQPPAGRDRQRAGDPLPPDRRRRRDPASWFRDVETVLITAGASAPEQVVQECIEYLETQLRRDLPGRDGPQGKRPFPAAQVAAAVAAGRGRRTQTPTSTRDRRRTVGCVCQSALTVDRHEPFE